MIIVLHLLDYLLQGDVFSVLVDELLLSALEVARQFKFLLSRCNLLQLASLVVLLQLPYLLTELSRDLLLLLRLYFMYLCLHQRYLLPQLAHQLILLPLCLLTRRLRRQQCLQLSYHSLIFTSVGLSFLGLLDG